MSDNEQTPEQVIAHNDKLLTKISKNMEENRKLKEKLLPTPSLPKASLVQCNSEMRKTRMAKFAKIQERDELSKASLAIAKDQQKKIASA